MKYKLLRLSLLSMLAMFFGGLAYAQDETIDFSALGYDNAAEVTTVQGTDVTLTFDKGTNNNTPKYYTTGTAVRMYGGNTLTVSSSTKTIEKVVFTFSSSSNNLNDPTVDEGSYDSETSTWTGSASEFTITRGGTSGHARIQKMEFYYAAGGEADTRAATTLTLGDYQTTGVVGESMNLPTVTVQDAAGAPVENAEIEWTSSNTDVAAITDGIISFNATGTTTIKASFAGDDNYKASSASFTLTVMSAPLQTVSELTALENGTAFQFDGKMLQVVAKPTSYHLFVKDATGSTLIYDNSGKKTDAAEVGKYLRPGWTGKVSIYKNLFEVVPDEALSVYSEDELPSSEVVYPEQDLAYVNADHINEVITLKGVTYTVSNKNLTIALGETSVAGYNQFNIDIATPEDGKTYDMVGAVSRYNDNIQFQPITIVEAAEVAQEEGYVYRDFAVQLTNADIFATDVMNFGVKVAEDGTYTATAANDETANFTVNASSYNGTQHGWVNCTFTVPVQGAVKIELGDCQYGSQNGTITDAAGNVTDIKANATKKCWSANAPHENVVVAYYAGTEPTTLTIEYTGYCPFIAVTAIDPSEIPNEATLTFDVANAGAEGVAPAAQKVEIGATVTIPANTTLYNEGYTLTAWTDGTAEYVAGQQVTVSEDITLTPVFTENAAAFADRTAETTITWQFGEGNGAGTLNAQGKSTILVAQATIGESVIDVKMDIDATNGKINNVGRGDKWAQCADGTVLTIPAYKGTAVSFDSYSDGTGTTIGGVEATDKAATYDGTAETLDIVAKGMGYIASVTAVYPVPAQDEPGDETAHTWDFTQWSEATVENLKADAAASKTEGWSDVEKKADAEADADPTEASKDNCFWYVGGEAEPTANGTAIAELAGLEFNTTYGASRSLAIAVNYPTALSTYDGPAYLWLGGTSQTCFTIKNVKVGSDLTMKVESHKTSDARGVQLFVGDQQIGEDFTPKTAEEKTFNISADQFADAETVDIVVKNTSGCHIYYIDAEIIQPTVPAETTVTFDIANVEAEGVAPDAQTVSTGTAVTIPANYTLYKEGYTLTAWSDGTTEYAVGETVATKGEPITLTPVFTKNTFELASRQEAVTVKFDFQRKNGAPTMAWEGKTGLVWVAQANVNDKTIDVKADVSTSPGKFANANWEDWAQLNNGTTFTVPSCKGATVSIEAYNELGADGKTATTIDGQSDYTSGKTISYTIAGSAETVDVVIGNDGTYYRYIQVVLPVVESQDGGETFVNETAEVYWAFNNKSTDEAEVIPDEGIKLASVIVGSNLTETTGTPSVGDNNGVKMIRFNDDKSGGSIQWVVQPVKGLTFTPTHVSGKIARFATDGVTLTISVQNKEGQTTTLASGLHPARDNKTKADDKWGNDANYATNFSYDIPASFATEEEFVLIATIGGGTDRGVGFADIKIEGTLNGTVANVNKYTLATAVAPAEAGSINVYPVAEEYEEGSTVKLTATENFGYDFVNWTNAEGEAVSTDPVYTFDIAKNETLTANFKQVETYELALTVDGTNDYMVTISPAPTVVDGKNMYEAGTAVQLTANQYEGLVTFNNWSTGETSSSKLISMTADTELTAVYSQADIVAGWDFYTPGNNGRVADFASEDNTTAALSLVLTSDGTTTASWLDKSTEAANGYESFKGAAVNWNTGSSNGDVGNYHWQTKVNAEQFTDINVQFQMLYNYNAYQKYNAEYSTDGETWTNFGSISMTGAKAVASFKEKLPAAANNQKNLYIRMLADTDSSVDGTASKNDGNTLAMFFITGTQALVDDGTAPELVSTVPTQEATGVSATGKIVLTFDEKIKLTESAAATLNGQTLTPVVSGKTVSFEYKGLEYSSDYTFTLSPGSVSDLTDNVFSADINITFTTMTRPTVTKGLYDAVVEDADQLVAAISEANSRSDKNVRYRIFVKNGTYTLPLSETETISSDDGNSYAAPYTSITASNISFIGESRDGVVITNAIPASAYYKNTSVSSGYTSSYDGIGKSDVLQLQSSVRGTYFQDLTVKSGIGDALGRNLAIQDKGSQTIYMNTGLYGYQDTWTSNNDNGLYYFEGGFVRGRTDYMCGKGDAFFNAVELRQIAGGYAAVPSKSIKYGFVYKDCVINGEAATVNSETGDTRTASQANSNYTLGRPWGSGTPVALYIDTKMNVVPSASGWNEMSNGWPKRFAEWNSTNSSGTAVDLSGRKKTFGDGHENNPVLTAEEALEAGNLHNMFGDWDPTLLTEQAPVPQNVKQSGNALVWDGSDYALLWAIVKDGKVVDFTTEPTYELTESGTYAVRAANEMGGLSEASESVAVEITEAETVTPEFTEAGYATFSCDKPLDFSKAQNVKGYVASKVSGSNIIMKKVEGTVPAATGLFLQRTGEGTPTITIASESSTQLTNLLKANLNEATVNSTSGKFVYVFAQYKTSEEKSDLGFYLVNTSVTVPAGKAYLELDEKLADASSRLNIVFADEANGIADVMAGRVNREDVYNLQGQRVNVGTGSVPARQKGLYIVGGKKRLIK